MEKRIVSPRLRAACVAFAIGGAFVVANSKAAAPPVTPPATCKVFVLAGQSNMQGQAVVDLAGEDYNEGRGTLAWLAERKESAPLVAHLRTADGSWRTRDDVFVSYRPESQPVKNGPLGFGFTGYPGGHHFGPEIGFGHVIGDAIEEPVLLVKTAWGGKSLFRDFRPPSSGGEIGSSYRCMIDDVRTALLRIGEEFPSLAGVKAEVAGFVWYQGWNDGVDPEHAVPEYEQNLVHLIRDVRRDLAVPDLPVVIGELTGPWVAAPGAWQTLRDAQKNAASRKELRDAAGATHVVFVPTAAFVRKPGDSPNPGHGHHEFGNAETCLLVGKALGEAMRSLVFRGSAAFTPTVPQDPADVPVSAEMSGYMLVPVDRVPAEFNSGFSLYSAAWPLVERYPGSRFQSGLFGTWMFAQFARGPDGRPDPGDDPKDMYSDIEGGLGWWCDTRFATTTPKFIMGGVAPDFVAWANGPGAGKGRDWEKPLGKYAVAQLSPWVVWPPDGLNLAQGTCGELFGYGYLPLPLVDRQPATEDRAAPTGDRCWTLFLNTANFKGPLCFFTPNFWTEHARSRPELTGKLLDTRPSEPNKAFQMETQWIPAAIAAASPDGLTYGRVAAMSFPIDAHGRTVVLHRLTSYSSVAITDAVRAWFAGGEAPSGAFDVRGAFVQEFRPGGGSTWRLFPDGTAHDDRVDIDWGRLGSPTVHDKTTFGYTWDSKLVRKVDDGGVKRVRLPEFFRLERAEAAADRTQACWKPVPPESLPNGTGLDSIRFDTPPEHDDAAYVTPDAPDSPFRSPGPVAGPFETTLGDGSTVTYNWYRFADQPAMVMAGLPAAAREESQRRIELIHRAWRKDHDYLPPPTTGEMASLDPGLLVTPPDGLEVGYVPIAIRQERRGKQKQEGPAR